MPVATLSLPLCQNCETRHHGPCGPADVARALAKLRQAGAPKRSAFAPGHTPAEVTLIQPKPVKVTINKRGRPRTGSAKSHAERQHAYKLRQQAYAIVDARQGGTCLHCADLITEHDHVEARGMGGRHNAALDANESAGNIEGLCKLHHDLKHGIRHA